ncbi:hypothetical protein L596_026400 [Steinernema carpocapsae]|nr:hypothetical protein L596_026400 [Steinernema carpocapsae]
MSKKQTKNHAAAEDVEDGQVDKTTDKAHGDLANMVSNTDDGDAEVRGGNVQDLSSFSEAIEEAPKKKATLKKEDVNFMVEHLDVKKKFAEKKLDEFDGNAGAAILDLIGY